MRLFFFMLLLTNILFLAFNLIKEPDQQQEFVVDNSIPELVLLSEVALFDDLNDSEDEEDEQAIDTNNQNRANESQTLVSVTANEIVTDEEVIKTIEEKLAENLISNQTAASEEIESAGIQDLVSKLKIIDEFNTNEQQSIQEISQKNETTNFTTQCFSSGPYTTLKQVNSGIKFLRSIQISAKQRQEEQRRVIGQLVYIPSHSSREEATKTINTLRARGVRDYQVLNEAGKEYAISLGVFGKESNARDRQRAVEKFNLKVNSETRYKIKDVYWLDYAVSNAEQLKSSTAEMKKLNIKVIKKNC